MADGVILSCVCGCMEMGAPKSATQEGTPPTERTKVTIEENRANIARNLRGTVGSTTQSCITLSCKFS